MSSVHHNEQKMGKILLCLYIIAMPVNVLAIQSLEDR